MPLGVARFTSTLFPASSCIRPWANTFSIAPSSSYVMNLHGKINTLNQVVRVSTRSTAAYVETICSLEACRAVCLSVTRAGRHEGGISCVLFMTLRVIVSSITHEEHRHNARTRDTLPRRA